MTHNTRASPADHRAQIRAHQDQSERMRYARDHAARTSVWTEFKGVVAARGERVPDALERALRAYVEGRI